MLVAQMGWPAGISLCFFGGKQGCDASYPQIMTNRFWVTQNNDERTRENCGRNVKSTTVFELSISLFWARTMVVHFCSKCLIEQIGNICSDATHDNDYK